MSSFLPKAIAPMVSVLCCLMFLQPVRAAKRALLVAVGNYPASSGWQPINAGNDIDLLTGVLKRQGFEQANTFVLLHESATRNGILAAIRTHLLQKCNPGDEVYFHFSGHGQQVADNNGDEPDGLDEAIVPYDSPMRFQPGVYEGANLIRDDELGELFNQIRARIGTAGQLIIVLDACHSGTGTRGNSVARGTDHVMADSQWMARNTSRGTGSSDQFLSSGNAEGVKALAPVVAFFGASANQLNFEATDDQGRRVGSLSYAWSKALSQAGPRTTYRGIFESIRSEMAAIAPRQSPQVEGEIDRTLFGGDVTVAPVYYRITSLDAATGSVVIDGGWLQGLNQGSVVGFFPPETRDPLHEKPWTTGVVEQSGALACSVKPEPALREEQAKSAWVYVLEENPGDLRIRVHIKPFSGPLYSHLKDKMAQTPVIELAEDADLFIEQQGSELQLLTADDQVLLSMPVNSPPAPAEKKFMQQIFNFGQVKFLRNLNALSRDIRLSMEIIPVSVDPRTGAETVLQQKRNAAGTLVLNEGDLIKVRVTNNGSIPAYFTLVDLQPDYQLNILIPNDKQTPEEFRVAPGQSMEVAEVWSIGPPYGPEIFKLIGTSSPVDLRPIAGSRGSATRSNSALSPLEKMFGASYYNDECMTRGGKVHRLSAGTVAVCTVPFTIAP